MTKSGLAPNEQSLFDAIKELQADKSAMAFYSIMPRMEDIGIQMPEHYLEIKPRVPTIIVGPSETGEEFIAYSERGEKVAEFSSFEDLESWRSTFPGHSFQSMGDLPGHVGKSFLDKDPRFDNNEYDRLDWHHKLQRVRAYLAFKSAPDFDRAYLLLNNFFIRTLEPASRRTYLSEVPVRFGYTESGAPFVDIPQQTRDIEFGDSDLNWDQVTGFSMDDATVRAANHVIYKYDWNGVLRTTPSEISERKAITLSDLEEIRSDDLRDLRKVEHFPLPKIAIEYLQHHPDEEQKISQAHAEWMEAAFAWVDNPNDPALAYRFLDAHPALWSFTSRDGEGMSFRDIRNSENELNEGGEDGAYAEFLRQSVLKTSGQARTFWTGIGSNNGKRVYMMEMGAAVPPLRNHHYHDMDIDTWEDSFEKCYIQTAIGVLAIFGLDDREKIVPGLLSKWGAETSEGRICYRLLRGLED